MYPIKSNNTGLIIELVKIYDVDNVKISLSEKCLYIYMKLSPILFMLELEQYVEYIYFDLCQYTIVIL